MKKAQAKQGKIYVGKLKAELTDEAIKEFFGQYGSIATVEQPFDKVKNERKNFCFITFDKEDTAKKLLKEGSVHISGHELEIKKVNPPNKGMQGKTILYLLFICNRGISKFIYPNHFSSTLTNGLSGQDISYLWGQV